MTLILKVVDIRYRELNVIMIRILDIFFALLGLILGGPVLVLIFLIGLFDTGSPVFSQERLGKNKRVFTLYKFRTMKVGTKSVATHLAKSASITPFGRFLRKTKLDELPQLWNVLKGEMSLVGPRPGLPDHEELTIERGLLGVFKVRPGITGLAQVNHIDMSTPKKLAEIDNIMINNLGLKDYFSYIFLTVIGKGTGDKVKE